MQLVTIAGQDFTNLITVPSYQVNKNDVYKSWTDANHVEHRYRTRTKVSGSFTLFFPTVEDYRLFQNTINSQKVLAGYVPNCQIYCNNIDQIETVDLFIDFSFPDILPVIGSNKNEECQVTITER